MGRRGRAAGPDRLPFLHDPVVVDADVTDENPVRGQHPAQVGQHPFGPILTGPSLVTKANVAQVQQLYKSTGIPLFNGGYPQ